MQTTFILKSVFLKAHLANSYLTKILQLIHDKILFFYCIASYPKIEVFPTVQPDLIMGKSYNIPSYPPTPSLESVFKCNFTINAPESYVYDVTWYIEGSEVKRNKNVLYENINSTFLKNTDWVDSFKLNMKVHCLKFYQCIEPHIYFPENNTLHIQRLILHYFITINKNKKSRKK